jgi:arginine-tRNA-protein transferase
MTDRRRMRRAYTEPHACSYLDDQEAQMEVLLSDGPADGQTLAWLADNGYRRNGGWHYRPACPSCAACIPTRIPVASFVPSRSQRRTVRDNQDLNLELRPVSMDPPRHELYQRYQAARHPDGEMLEHGPEECLRFLAAADPDISRGLEAWDGDRLLGVMVLDQMPDSLSCVYSFFDPDHGPRSLGTYLVLAAIQLAQDRRLRWLYLGYRIAERSKMAYKTRFRPRQELAGGKWSSVK